MKIIGESDRIGPVYLLEIVQGFLEKIDRFNIFHVPDMLADNSGISPGKSKCILDFSATSQHIRTFIRHHYRLGYIPARTTDEKGLSIAHPDH